VAVPGQGKALLASWRELLDEASLLAGAPGLAAMAKRPVAVVSAGTAAALGLAEGGAVRVSTSRGAITVPYRVAPMPDQVVWLPANSGSSRVLPVLGACGGVVEVQAAAPEEVAA
jgi:NADH-quinone oxidoreductase subunit G